MRRYLHTFAGLFLRLLGATLILIPVVFLINHYLLTDFSLKIGYSEGIALPREWQDLLAVEVLLGLFFAACLPIYHWSAQKDGIENPARDWPPKSVLNCQWDLLSYSVNGIPLRSPLGQAAPVFGAPSAFNAHKLIYTGLGLDILYAARGGIIAGYMFHLKPQDTYKACPLRAKLSDGTWQTLSHQDSQQTLRTLLGVPVEKKDLKDGFTEIFYWENAKIQVFYDLQGRLNLILFANR